MKWTFRARNDLQAIYRHIEKDSPQHARRVAGSFLARAQTLQATPRLGRVVSELADVTIREIPVHAWRLIYQIRDRDLLVLALVHRRRDGIPADQPG